MKRHILVTVFLVWLVSGCGAPAVSAVNMPTTDPFIGVEQAARTAQAAQQEADFYSRQLTATAEAPILAITSTAAAFAMEQQFAQATQQSVMATETAAMTSTAMYWTPTPNATSTAIAMLAQAEGTRMANQTELDNLKLERERNMNNVKATIWYVFAFGAFMLFLMGGIGLIRKASVFVVPSDERGNPQPIFVDGIVMDIDRAPNGVMQASKGFLKQLPEITAERQDTVTHHDQLIDLRTRSAAVRRLKANLPKELPAPQQDQVQDEDLSLPLPAWEIINGWDGESFPLGVGRQGLITARAASPHILIAGKTGSGKTRYMLRTITAASLVKGETVINIGSDEIGFGVFGDHPNYYKAGIREPKDIVPCLAHVYLELKDRKEVIGGSSRDWEHWGGTPPRPFVTLLIDELGNMAEDLLIENASANREMWSLVARIANEGRKVGIRFAAALQDPTSKGMDLRFRRNCTLVSFQLGDQAHSNSFIGTGGAEQLDEGRFMARTDGIVIGGGFCPSDEEILAYLAGRRVQTAARPLWIENLLDGSNQIGAKNEPLPAVTGESGYSDEIVDLAESIRERWHNGMNKTETSMLFGKANGGTWSSKLSRIYDYLMSTSLNTSSSSAD